MTSVWIALSVVLGLLQGSAQAQQVRQPYRVGVLNEAWTENHPAVAGLKAGLRELGLEEGRGVTFDIRFTKGDPQATPAAAVALVRAGVDLIFTSNEASTQAAKAATRRIPIVFTLVGDPVAAGIVSEVAHHGGNVTGVSSLATELTPKRLEILKILVPTLRRIVAIYYAHDLSSLAAVRKAQEAVLLLKLELVARPVYTPEELARALKALQPGDGLLPPPLATLDIPAQILEASLSDRVPAVFPFAFWTRFGGLVSYGTDYYSEGHQAARLVAKILRGAQPQDLPVEAANKIELAVNLKIAKRLGLTVPRELLIRAEKLIQ